MYLEMGVHPDAKNFMPFDLDSGEFIKHCIWADDNKGTYCIYVTDGNGEFVLEPGRQGVET